jgi:hypothetical protein
MQRSLDRHAYIVGVAAADLFERPGLAVLPWLPGVVADIVNLVVVPLRANAQMPLAREIGKYAEVLATLQVDAEARAQIESLRALMAGSGSSTGMERVGIPSPELFCAVGVRALRRACSVPFDNPNNKRTAALCQALLTLAYMRARVDAPAKSPYWPGYLRRARDDQGQQATVARRVVDAVIEGAIAHAEMRRRQLYYNALIRRD